MLCSSCLQVRTGQRPSAAPPALLALLTPLPLSALLPPPPLLTLRLVTAACRAC